MKILGIETSCDETAICIIEKNGDTLRVLGNTVHSQIDVHVPYGGVFPSLAKREHQVNLIPVLEKTLTDAGILAKTTTAVDTHKIASLLDREPELLKTFLDFIPHIQKPDIDALSVTVGPGLEPALWVGINFAKALSSVWNIPLIPINHMEGHILISLLQPKTKDSKSEFIISQPKFPALAVLISGGHTELVLVPSVGTYTVIGETRDDAIGECFDKIARTLGLPYPGGPKISKLAHIARTNGVESPEKLPRPMIHSDSLDFSFSGLKTAVLYLVKKLGTLTEKDIQGISKETEDAITDVLIAKTESAINQYDIQSLIIGGGVIANTHIRKKLDILAKKHSISIHLPHVDHATDNGLMIALAGSLHANKGSRDATNITANGSLRITTN